MTVYQNETVDNAVKAFNAIKEKGVVENFKNMPTVKDKKHHYQGYAQYQHDKKAPIFYVFTKSDNDKGTIAIYRGNKDNPIRVISPIKAKDTGDDWNHPGGCQCVGQLLFVICESSCNSDLKDKSRLFVYDLEKIDTEKDNEKLVVYTREFDHTGACVGVTNFQWYGGEKSPCYMMVICSHGKPYSTYHQYISEIPSDRDMSKLNFYAQMPFKLSVEFTHGKDTDLDCQGIGLFAITNDLERKYYLLALYPRQTGLTFEDWVFMYKCTFGRDNNNNDVLTVEKVNINNDDDMSVVDEANFGVPGGRHLKNSGGDGLLAVHFRYGAGVRINPWGQICLLATSRGRALVGADDNAETRTLSTNWWGADTKQF